MTHRPYLKLGSIKPTSREQIGVESDNRLSGKRDRVEGGTLTRTGGNRQRRERDEESVYGHPEVRDVEEGGGDGDRSGNPLTQVQTWRWEPRKPPLRFEPSGH